MRLIQSRHSFNRRLVAIAPVVLMVSLACFAEPAHGGEQETPDNSRETGEKEKRPGRWKRFREEAVVGTQPDQSLTDEQIEQIRQLEALGYLDGVSPAPSVSGVTVNIDGRTWPGFNFYVSAHRSEAHLIDMEGNHLHSWSYDFDKAFPEKEIERRNWRRAHLYENGDVLAVWEGHGLIRLDKDSRLKWQYKRKPHHDLFVMDDGRVYVLARRARIIRSIHKTQPVLEDYIDLLDENGVLLKRLSILECFRASEYYWQVEQIVRQHVQHRLLTGQKLPGDIFHTNTIEVIGGGHDNRPGAFREGNLLVSLRTPSIVAIIDPDAEKVVWMAAGMWRHQHDPLLLSDGRMLIFDNEGNQGSSRVLEFDPLTQEVFWKFEGDPPRRFYSKCCGTVQRLPNGNTLITETDNGRALEVARDGTVVWEFISPHRAGDNNELIASLFDLVRIPSEWKLDWLEN